MKINKQRRNIILRVLQNHHKLSKNDFWKFRLKEKELFDHHGNESHLYFSFLKLYNMLLLQKIPHEIWPHVQTHTRTVERKLPAASEKTIPASQKKVKGLVPCKFCNHKEVIIYLRQLKGGDEGMTVFYQCPECNKRWRN